MKPIIQAILLCALFSVSHSATRSSLTEQLRRLTHEENTSTSSFEDTSAAIWLDVSQHKIVRLGGYISKHYDIVHSEDSLDYGLPTTFKVAEAVMLKKEGVWFNMLNNPYFGRDTSVVNYFIGWKQQDSARIYVKGLMLSADDTIRVFYRGSATPMLYDTSTCETPTDEQVFILEEAIRLYESWKIGNRAAGQAAYQQLRMDMGLMKQEEK